MSDNNYPSFEDRYPERRRNPQPQINASDFGEYRQVAPPLPRHATTALIQRVLRLRNLSPPRNVRAIVEQLVLTTSHQALSRMDDATFLGQLEIALVASATTRRPSRVERRAIAVPRAQDEEILPDGHTVADQPLNHLENDGDAQTLSVTASFEHTGRDPDTRINSAIGDTVLHNAATATLQPQGPTSATLQPQALNGAPIVLHLANRGGPVHNSANFAPYVQNSTIDDPYSANGASIFYNSTNSTPIVHDSAGGVPIVHRPATGDSGHWTISDPIPPERATTSLLPQVSETDQGRGALNAMIDEMTDHIAQLPIRLGNVHNLTTRFENQQNTRRILYRIREMCLGPQGEELLPTYLCEILAQALASEPEAAEFFHIDNTTFRSTVSSFLSRNRFRFPSIEDSNFYNVITSSTVLPFENPRPVAPTQDDDETLYIAEDPFAPRPLVRDEGSLVRPAQVIDLTTEAPTATPHDLPRPNNEPIDSHIDNDTFWRLQVRTLEVHPSPLVEHAAQAFADIIPQEVITLYETADRSGRPYYDEDQQIRINDEYMTTMTARCLLDAERDPVVQWNRVVQSIRLPSHVASGPATAMALQERNSNFYVPVLYRAFGILTEHLRNQRNERPADLGRQDEVASRRAQYLIEGQSRRPTLRNQVQSPRIRRNYISVDDVNRRGYEPATYDDFGRPPQVSVPDGHRATGDLRSENCVICLDEIGTRHRSVTTCCGHTFHSLCLRSWANNQRGNIVYCALCRTPLTFPEVSETRRSESTEPSIPPQPPCPPRSEARPSQHRTRTPPLPPPRRSQAPHERNPQTEAIPGPQTFSQVARSANPLPICTCPGRRTRRQGRHLIGCPVSGSSRRMSAPPALGRNYIGDTLPTANATLPQQHMHPSQPESQPDFASTEVTHRQTHSTRGPPELPPQSNPLANPLVDSPGFSYGNIVSLSAHLPTLREIPPAALTVVASAFATTVRAATSSTGTRRANATLNVYAFCVLILHRPPPITHRELNVATIVRERARIWLLPNGPSRLFERAQETVRIREAALGPRPNLAVNTSANGDPIDFVHNLSNGDHVVHTSADGIPFIHNSANGDSFVNNSASATLQPQGPTGATLQPQVSNRAPIVLDSANGENSVYNSANGVYIAHNSADGTFADQDPVNSCPVGHNSVIVAESVPSERTDFGHITRLLPGLSGFPLTPAAIKRAEEAATLGMYSRANTALSAQPLAPDNATTVEMLAQLHPNGGLPPPEYASRTFPEMRSNTEADIHRCISRFMRGTAGGPSGWRHTLLHQLVRHAGANVAHELVRFFFLLATNQLDSDALEFFFSARMLASYKSTSRVAVRPIACGEIFRRVSGKMSLSRVSSQAASYLTQRRQFAVGVPGGMEAIIHAAQKLVRAYIAEPATHARKVFVKGDLRNAYNICDRLKMIEAAYRRLPEIVPYLISAYARRTNLFLGTNGNVQISSESGVQQGDPVGTLGFSLVLAAACEEIAEALHDALDFEAFYADDSNIGGSIDAVATFFERLEALGPQFGFEFKREKFQVFCHDDLRAEAELRFRTTNIFPFEEAHTLGAPVGSQDKVDAFARSVIEATKRTFDRITEMTHMHKAASVLAFSGRGIATHLSRCSLPDLSVLRQLDSHFVKAACDIYGLPNDPHTAEELTKTYSKGGFCFRAIEPYARIAFLASELETRDLQSRLLKNEFMEDTVSRLLADSTVPAFDADIETAVREYVRQPNGRQLQKKWSRLLDNKNHRLPDNTRHRARTLSCMGSHVTLHPVLLEGEKFKWLDNDQCSVITRMRLGLPIFNVEQLCPFCRNATSDINGIHVLGCLNGGHHTRAHNAARDDIATLASRGLCGPRVEAHCFSDAPTRRIDVLMSSLTFDGLPTAADYAMVSHASYNVLMAATSVGGAATAYENVKRREYGELARQSRVFLAPMIQDVFGAWGNTARLVLSRITQRIADRTGQHRGSVAAKSARWLLSRHQRRVADILLMATPPDLTA